MQGETLRKLLPSPLRFICTASGSKATSSHVFYRSPAGKLMAVSLKMDKTSADVSTPRELFALPVSTVAQRGSQYDVGQDGKRFLILVAVKKAPLEMITNWQALLK